MTAFDPGIVGVAVCSDNISSVIDAEQVGKAKLLSPPQVLVVETRFEARHD